MAQSKNVYSSVVSILCRNCVAIFISAFAEKVSFLSTKTSFRKQIAVYWSRIWQIFIANAILSNLHTFLCRIILSYTALDIDINFEKNKHFVRCCYHEGRDLASFSHAYLIKVIWSNSHELWWKYEKQFLRRNAFYTRFFVTLIK